MDCRMKFIRPFLAAAFLFAAGAALAASSITFKTATAIMSTPDLAVGYVTLVSDKDDTLTGLSSPCCDAVELHTMRMKNDTMQMRKLDALPLKAGVPVTIGDRGAGDSMHLMLISVHKEMQPGEQFPILFHFAKSAPQKAIFTVTRRGAKTTDASAAAAQH